MNMQYVFSKLAATGLVFWSSEARSLMNIDPSYIYHIKVIYGECSCANILHKTTDSRGGGQQSQINDETMTRRTCKGYTWFINNYVMY